jgi:hypothetical protein
LSVPLPPRPVRRALLDPLWVPAAAALIVGFATVLLIAAVLAPLTRKRRVLRLCALAITYLVLDVILLLGGLGFWLGSPRCRFY